MNTPIRRHPASYRDPAGFVFEQDGVIFRQVNTCFQEHYDRFVSSGLYNTLVQKGFLIYHEEIPNDAIDNVYKILKPQQIPFITYPYEWSFTQLKEAALLTLEIQRLSLEHGMSLKDASPYNVQFQSGQPIFIDTLSWEILDENKPWVAYRQFCEMFLAPLALGHYGKQSANHVLLAWPEGIPLPLSSNLLPFRSKLQLDLFLHIHLHAKIGERRGDINKAKKGFSSLKLKQGIQSLEGAVKKLKLPETESNWSTYYQEVAERDEYLIEKKQVVDRWLKIIGPVGLALDAGCNTGQFSFLLAEHSKQVISVDHDESSIEQLQQYTQNSVRSDYKNILPIVQDLTRMSPGNGLLGTERSSFINRGPFELILGLALIHHLLISRKVPLMDCADLFAKLSTKHLILEYIPQQDPWAQLLKEPFTKNNYEYEQAGFECAFRKHFTIKEIVPIPNTDRLLYWFERL